MTGAICNQEHCTGCGACVAVCPKRCIALKPNPQGHLFPHIDQRICINCNLCRKTCPVNSPVSLQTPQACYAGWAKDEKDRTTSSSGAASSVFATHIIEQGGIVYGAALQNNKIQHIRVNNAQGLNLIKGSKYVYSYAADVYAQMKRDLTMGKTVLFMGTPCQNAAVYNLVGETPNLILVNLICHGVPSLQMLTDHLKAKKITKIQNLQFRNNNIYDLRCNTYQSSNSLFPDTYVFCFLKGYIQRPSCYHCTYAQAKRLGDITIGDFWGLGKKEPFTGGETTKGCSVIIVNTHKGNMLLHACQDKLQLFRRNYTEAVAGNDQLRAPVLNNYSIKFNKYYPKYTFEIAAWRTNPYILGRLLLKNLLKRYALALSTIVTKNRSS